MTSRDRELVHGAVFSRRVVGALSSAEHGTRRRHLRRAAAPRVHDSQRRKQASTSTFCSAVENESELLSETT